MDGSFIQSDQNSPWYWGNVWKCRPTLVDPSGAPADTCPMPDSPWRYHHLVEHSEAMRETTGFSECRFTPEEYMHCWIVVALNFHLFKGMLYMFRGITHYYIYTLLFSSIFTAIGTSHYPHSNRFFHHSCNVRFLQMITWLAVSLKRAKFGHWAVHGEPPWSAKSLLKGCTMVWLKLWFLGFRVIRCENRKGIQLRNQQPIIGIHCASEKKFEWQATMASRAET